MIRSVSFILLILCLNATMYGNNQTKLKTLGINSAKGIKVESVHLKQEDRIPLPKTLPLFSIDINNETVSASSADLLMEGDSIRFRLTDQIEGSVKILTDFEPGWKARVTFYNRGDSAVHLSNFVPLGKDKDHLYITASGPWSLARTKLFRPDHGPIGVVLPDNAWDLGYSDITINEDYALCAMSRRQSTQKAERKRWGTEVKSGGSVAFAIWAEGYTGHSWRDGMRIMFQERYLYDIKGSFDNSLYEREDLQWIRHSYVMNTHMPWDHKFYDIYEGGYQLKSYFDQMEQLFGGWDVYVLWPTWPMLGMDQRNQWDLYGDLPGGLTKVRAISEALHRRGGKLFVSYNPWDRSTRYVDPYEGMADLIRKTKADGVVLDTYGHSTDSLQRAADSVKPGVVMYSEGMAVPKDMQGIVTGRVHDAIFLPPPLNMNKFIKPNNAIFRVCQLFQGRLHREVGVALFNGYGIEMNVMGAGRPDWIEDEYHYLGKAARILRENTYNFHCQDWTPLLPTTTDSIWVNRWPGEDKTLYTVFSLEPEGFEGPLFEAPVREDKHYVSLWHHEEITPDTIDHQSYIPARTRAFNRSWLNTRREGNVDVIACLAKHLWVERERDRLTFEANAGDEIRVWAGSPAYSKEAATFGTERRTINLTETFGRHEGKIVVQLMNEDILLDERIVDIPLRLARLISEINPTPPAENKPEDMVLIPAGNVTLHTSKNSVWVIPNPEYGEEGKEVKVDSIYMDRYPVTNRAFKQFMDETGYMPEDTVNFLSHWKNGTYKEGRGNHPVVCVSFEDAKAYAQWVGKRLPTEAEWLYSARGSTDHLWPWGAEFDSSRCNVAIGHSTPVNAFPSGASPFGVMDMVGNVWQLTNDVYDNGSNYYIILRGGSYYDPTSSWWYVKGGPQPLDRSQILLRVSPGFERNATVGFRCVKDL